jgi:hypothetical protein
MEGGETSGARVQRGESATARCAGTRDDPVFPLRAALVSLRRSAQVALYCAHRTSTFRSCAFCEQEGHLAAPPLSFPVALVYPFKGGLVDPLMRASNDTNDPSKLARSLSGMGAD